MGIRSIKKHFLILAHLFALVLFAAHSVHAQSRGAIDTTLGTLASNYYAINTTVTGSVQVVMQLPDGRILGAGSCATGFGIGSCAYQWTAAGAPDPSFGVGGVSLAIVANISGSTAFSSVVGMVRRADGSILVSGPCATGLCVAQLTASGAYDTSFGLNGISQLGTPTSITVTTSNAGPLVLLPDGRVLFSGLCRTSSDHYMCLARLNPNGFFDASFGSSNWALATIVLGSSRGGPPITLLPDGRFLTAATCGGGTEATSTTCVSRWLSSGTLQYTYNIDVPGAIESPQALRVFGSQATVAEYSVNSTRPFGDQLRAFASRFDIYAVPGGVDDAYGAAYPNGGIAGPINIDSLANGTTVSGTVLRDGSALFAGSCNAGAAVVVFCTMKLASNGTLDVSYGVGGRYEYAGYALFENKFSFAETNNDKLLIVGTCADARPCVLRINLGPSTASACNMDLDGDGIVNATTDGLILIRAALGFKGTAVTTGALGSAATRTFWPQIQDYLFDQCGMSVSVN